MYEKGGGSVAPLPPAADAYDSSLWRNYFCQNIG